LSNVKVVGVDAHIGSQITSVEPFVESVRRLVELVEKLGDEGIILEHIDIGGGLGIRYRDETPPEPAEWVKALLPVLEPTGLKVIFEPGRSLVGNAGILLTKVLYVKETPHKNFIVVDAAMTDLIRPALYGAYHEVLPVERRGEEEIVADIVGPVCESGDFLAKGRSIERPRRGDLLAVMSAGAYGFVMSSNYNARPRPAEVFVKGDRFQVVRERESYGDLVRGERLGI
ncbi:MAG: diaminopimelate decarboxylase, partial [Candidatus Latescibacterota bacterium]